MREMTQWVDRVQEVTGWREPRWEYDWSEVESMLGGALPVDYKELCERFGPGTFSWHIYAAPPGEEFDSLLYWWRKHKTRVEKAPRSAAEVFSPYGLYWATGKRGLVYWGRSETEGSFYWLADSGQDPAIWPVVARLGPELDEEWYRFDISASEFVYRVIADPEFRPFTICDPRKVPPRFDRRPESFTRIHRRSPGSGA